MWQCCQNSKFRVFLPPAPKFELLMEELETVSKNTPTPKLELLMEDLETLFKNQPTPPGTGTSYGGLCIEDWCMKTNRCIPHGYRLVPRAQHTKLYLIIMTQCNSTEKHPFSCRWWITETRGIAPALLLPSATVVAERLCFHKHVSRILSTGGCLPLGPGGVQPPGQHPRAIQRNVLLGSSTMKSRE